MVYIANWVIICYLLPIKGTRKLHWPNLKRMARIGTSTKHRPSSTFLPIIMAQWKKGVSPEVVTPFKDSHFSQNQDYGKKSMKIGFFTSSDPPAFHPFCARSFTLFGCFQKLWYPKMDGENNGKPYFLMDDLGGNPPIFGNTHFTARPCWKITMKNRKSRITCPLGFVIYAAVPSLMGSNKLPLFPYNKGVVINPIVGFHILIIRIAN